MTQSVPQTLLAILPKVQQPWTMSVWIRGTISAVLQPHHTLPGGGGGVLEAKKSLCTENKPQFQAHLMTFTNPRCRRHFARRGWVGRPSNNNAPPFTEHNPSEHQVK